MNNLKIISLMVSASMAFNVIGTSARTLLAETDGVGEEVQIQTTEQIDETENTDSNTEESAPVDEEETSPIEPDETSGEIIDGDDSQEEGTDPSESGDESDTSDESDESSESEESEESDESSESEESEESDQTDETDETEETEETEESEEEEEEEELVAFSAEAVIDGVLISVSADEGVFPAGSYMVATRAYDAGAEALVDSSRAGGVNVVRSLTFDISIYDEDGNEIEPDTEMGSVYVSFSDVLVADVNLDVDVYHITDNAAYEMSSNVYDNTVVVETDSFSYYTVEFTYGDMEYVLPGDSVVALSDILTYVGLQGEVSAASVSNPSLFNAYQDNGVWYVSAQMPFVTNEWMIVNISGIDYTIQVTDAISQADENENIGYRLAQNTPASWSNRGYDVYGYNSAHQELSTTWRNGGYASRMRVGTTSVELATNNIFRFGEIYNCAGIEAYITAAIQGERAVAVTYTLTNTTENIITVDIGSYADCEIHGDDSADIEVNSNGIRMYSGNDQFFLIPGSGDFDTCWFGKYSAADDNVFSGTHTTGRLTNTDSGLAFSWNIIIPAGATVTRVAIFTAGENMESHTITFNKNSDEATGTMANQLIIQGIAGSITGNRFTRPGYSFVGWAESPTGPVVYSDQQQITLSADKTLYAVWMPSSVILHDPTAIPGLVYNGSAQTLLTGGGAENGTIMFSLDRVNYSPNYPTGINATSYTIYYKAVGNPGYGDSEVRQITNSIAPISLDNVVVTPPEAIPGLTYTGDPQILITPGTTNLGNILQYSLSETSGYSRNLPTGTDARTYTVWYSIPASQNYTGTYGPFSLTVDIAKTNAVLDAAPEGVTVTYNATAQSLVTGGSATGGTIVYSLDGTNFSDTITGTDAGTYTIYYKIQGDSNHNDIPGGQITSVVNRAPATIEAVDMSKIYGDNDPTLTVRTTGVVSGDTLVYSISRRAGEDAGVYPISLICLDSNNPNYTITSVLGGLFTIIPKDLTITANNTGKTYGTADPTLTATLNGVVGSDVINYTLSRVAGENAGTYTINVIPGENPNYHVRTVTGTFTIAQAVATVSVDNDQSKVYGEDDPALTATVTGLVGQDVLVYTLSRAAGEDVGDYHISVTLGQNPNYTVVVNEGTFTITPKAATITADDISKVYGDNDPELTVVFDGLVRGETTLDYTISRVAGENVGDYEITVTAGNNPNYTVTVTGATFTITPAPATITADDISREYGHTDPALTVTYAGLQRGDTDLDFTIEREQGENVGDYVITVTAGTNPNYNVSVVPGTFTITPANATITAIDNTKVYGSADPVFEVTFDGLVNGDTELDYTIARETGENVGTYVITVTNGNNPNYTVTTVPATFTITPADATITANDLSKIYGDSDPALTVSYTGLVNGDTALDYTIARAEGENAGEYVITVTPGTNRNYNVSTATGIFTIEKADPVVTAPVGFSLYYNGEAQALFDEGSTTGGTLQYSLDGENYATGVRSASGLGTYTIWYRVLGDNNYNDVAPAFINTTIYEVAPPPVPVIVDGETIMVDSGEPLPRPATPSRYGYDFIGWYADEACTIPIDFNSIVGHEGIQMYSGWAEINYRLTEGADGEWTDGGDQLVFRAVRNRAEETTFSHYMNVYVDGNLLGPDDFVAESGSVIIRLNPDFLATLAVGEHILDIEFDDAEGVRTKFYILGDAVSRDRILSGINDPTVASTGENFSIKTVMFFAASAVCAIVGIKTRKKEED